jgi:hypothetical protein
MSTGEPSPKTRWGALLIIGILLSIWVMGLSHAFQDGFWSNVEKTRPAPFIYPMDGVLVACRNITAEFVMLFAILRPFSFSGPRRLLIALAVFLPLQIGEQIFVSGWLHQPGYKYSNGVFLTNVVGCLIIAAVLNLLMLAFNKVRARLKHEQ